MSWGRVEEVASSIYLCLSQCSLPFSITCLFIGLLGNIDWAWLVRAARGQALPITAPIIFHCVDLHVTAAYSEILCLKIILVISSFWLTKVAMSNFIQVLCECNFIFKYKCQGEWLLGNTSNCMISLSETAKSSSTPYSYSNVWETPVLKALADSVSILYCPDFTSIGVQSTSSNWNQLSMHWFATWISFFFAFVILNFESILFYGCTS